MSRVLLLVVNQLSKVSTANHNLRVLSYRLNVRGGIRPLSQMVSFQPLALAQSQSKRGYLELGSKWKHYNEWNELFIASGILTFFGVRKEEDAESELITTIKRGILLIQKNKFKKAEQMLHIALKLAQEQRNTDAITYIYDLLANLAYDSNELWKAHDLFVEVINRLVASGTEINDNKILHMSLKLATIYCDMGNPKEAESGFQFCESNLQKKVESGYTDEDTLLLWAMTLDYYARFVLDQNRLKEAFKYFEKAYNTSLQVNGPIHEHNAVLLNDLGTVSCLLNNYDDAMKYLKQAVNITKSITNLSDAASIYVNLGVVYLKKQMFEEAKAACKEGWRNAKAFENQEVLKEANLCLDEINRQFAEWNAL